MEPSVTDWIQAIGVLLGIPVTLWGIFSLFIKDKDKAKQIESLHSIAKNHENVVKKLSEQIEQLTIHSNHFQYQNALMFEANQLVEKQIELQNKIYSHEVGIEENRAEIEKQKHLNSIKPHFITNGILSSPSNFSLTLENKGGTAKNLRIINTGTRFVWFYPLEVEDSIDKYGLLNIKGGPNPENTFLNGNNVTFEINIEFENIDGNLYYQNIKRFGNGNYKIEDPQLK